MGPARLMGSAATEPKLILGLSGQDPT